MNTSANLIIPNLWIGNYNSSMDIEFIKEKNISIIINCTKENETFIKQIPEKIDKVYRFHFPLEDPVEGDLSYIESFRENLEKILIEIDKQLSQGKTILVHCLAGLNRSAAVVASYIITRNIKLFEDNFDIYELINYIRERRNGTFPSTCIISDILVPLYKGLPFGGNINNIQIILKIPLRILKSRN